MKEYMVITNVEITTIYTADEVPENWTEDEARKSAEYCVRLTNLEYADKVSIKNSKVFPREVGS